MTFNKGTSNYVAILRLRTSREGLIVISVIAKSSEGFRGSAKKDQRRPSARRRRAHGNVNPMNDGGTNGGILGVKLG